jgi:hypothetical protein
MKKLLLFLIVTLISTATYAQVPQGFNFQAVAAGSDGLPLINTEIGVQVSILADSETGDAVYTEAHTVTTNAVGLLQLVIGEGTAAAENNFSAVAWASGNYYVKLAIDPAGGTSYQDLGTTRLLTVPYAMVANEVVGGSSGNIGDFPYDLNLNTTNPDTAFVINIEGDSEANPFQVYSKSTGFNAAIYGEAVSEAENTENQRGTYGVANGAGSGQHVGVFGGAVNFDATGDTRRGVYGQAASKAKYNYGMFGLAAGDGDGSTENEAVPGDFGSFNIGGFYQAYGNLNGNVGAEGIAAGSSGNLRNFGVIGTSRTEAEGRNIGGRFEAFNSSTTNVGAEGVASGGSSNIGVLAEAFNGTSNIALLANADTAAVFNGVAVINGDLTVNGTINNAGGSQSNVEVKNSSDLVVASLAAQGDNQELSGGLFLSGTNTSNVELGGKTWENADRPYLKFTGSSNNEAIWMDVYEADGVERGNITLKGTDGQEFGMNANGLYGSQDLNWSNNINLAGNVNSDIGFNANNRVQVLGNLNETGAGGIEILDANSTLRIFADASSGSFQVKRASDSGTIINMTEFSGGGQFLMSNSSGNDFLYADASSSAFQLKDSDGNTTVSIDAAFGNATFNGTVTEASDVRLKKNIKGLNNALTNTLKMRGVSYDWKDESKSDRKQIGVIAQEVEEIYPEFVMTDENGMKSVNYSQMVAVLIEAVKELNTKIESLESENAVLTAQVNEIDALKVQISAIQSLLEMNTAVSTAPNK